MGKDYARFLTPEELTARRYIPEKEAIELLGLTKGKDFDWFHYDYIDSYQTGADGQTWVLLLPKVAARLGISPSPSSLKSLPSLSHIQNPKSKIKNRNSDWMTQEEARAYLGVSRNTLYNWMQSGILRYAATRPRLVRREDVEKRAEEDWFAELQAHLDRIRRPRMRPYRRDGQPLVSDEQFQLCALRLHGHRRRRGKDRRVAREIRPREL